MLGLSALMSRQAQQWDDLMSQEDTSDVLTTCPRAICKDVIPLDPPEPLASLIKRAEALIRENGRRDTVEFIVLSVDICRNLTNVLQHDSHVKEARRLGYPVSIAWQELPKRIFDLKDDIIKLLHDPLARECNVIHEHFLDSLEAAGLGRNYKKLAHGKNAPRVIFRNARPG